MSIDEHLSELAPKWIELRSVSFPDCDPACNDDTLGHCIAGCVGELDEDGIHSDCPEQEEPCRGKWYWCAEVDPDGGDKTWAHGETPLEALENLQGKLEA